MRLIKPIWHTGTWSKTKQNELIVELIEAEKFRSLTNEEGYWLRQLGL
jgi:hypothetical protein